MANKTIEDLQTPKETVQQALRLLREGDSKTQIAKQLGVSRKSLSNWAKWGILTDGEPWDEYLEKQEKLAEMESKTEQLTVETEELAEFQEFTRTKLESSIRNVLEKMEQGKISMDVGDLETMMKIRDRMENRGERFQAIVNRFMRLWFKAAAEVLGEQKFKQLVMKKKEIERELMEEMNVESVDSLVENNYTEAEQYENH
jgi:predicted transcriptional regulator